MIFVRMKIQSGPTDESHDSNQTTSIDTSSNQIGGVVLVSVLMETDSNLTKNHINGDMRAHGDPIIKSETINTTDTPVSNAPNKMNWLLSRMNPMT